jgi:hypothetical protein
MKPKFTVAHLVAAAFLSGVGLGAIGFWEGSRVGVREFQLADAKYEAFLTVYQLKALKRQDLTGLETWMQIRLDGSLALHGAYLDSHWKWLWPDLASSDREIKDAAKFRLEHPFSEPDASSPTFWKAGMDMNDPFVLYAIEGQRRNKELIAKVLAKYGE